MKSIPKSGFFMSMIDNIIPVSIALHSTSQYLATKAPILRIKKGCVESTVPNNIS